MIAGSTCWRGAAKAANAALALQLGTPAERWYHKDMDKVKTWVGFKKKLVERDGVNVKLKKRKNERKMTILMKENDGLFLMKDSA